MLACIDVMSIDNRHSLAMDRSARLTSPLMGSQQQAVGWPVVRQLSSSALLARPVVHPASLPVTVSQ